MENKIRLCDYGCGQEAKYQFKNGKHCCSKNHTSCQKIKEKNSLTQKGYIPWNKGKKHTEETKNKISSSLKDGNHPNFGKHLSEETKYKISERKKGNFNSAKRPEVRKKLSEVNKGKIGYWKGRRRIFSKEWKENIGKPQKLTIDKIKEKYPFFSKVEEMRYNPDKSEEKEIQVHCKNSSCINSKEKGGWFTPTKGQFAYRIWALEHKDGNDGCYLYCSHYCKQECPLYGLRSDPYKETEKSYTEEEYQTFRKFVLERDYYKCQFCGDKAIEVHHERPQKLEPFFGLDPDYALSCCKDCHYKFGHKDECSTGNLARKIC